MEKRRLFCLMILAQAWITTLSVSVAVGQPVVTVTLNELMQSGHRVEVVVGARVVWTDPHFDRIWFGGPGAPAVERRAGTLEAVFGRVGTYRGAFTLLLPTDRETSSR